jgi:hypothetical protein
MPDWEQFIDTSIEKRFGAKQGQQVMLGRYNGNPVTAGGVDNFIENTFDMGDGLTGILVWETKQSGTGGSAGGGGQEGFLPRGRAGVAPVSVIHTWSLPRVHNIKSPTRVTQDSPSLPTRLPDPPDLLSPSRPEQHITLPRPRQAAPAPSHLYPPAPEGSFATSSPFGAHIKFSLQRPV